MKGYGILFCMIAKRLLCRKGFLACLIAVPLLTGCLYLWERETPTAVYAAIYSPDREKWESAFQKEEGLIRFYFCASREELVRDVVRGKAECGYVLQEDLQNKFEQSDWSWGAEVYKSSATMLDKLINETVFGIVFHEISSNWYEGYIANLAGTPTEREKAAVEAARILRERESDGSTFALQVRAVGGPADIEQAAVYGKEEGTGIFPMEGIALAGILLCGLFGSMQAVSDRGDRLFANRHFPAVAAADVTLPAVCGTLSGFAALGFRAGRLPFLCGSLMAVIVFCFVLQWIVRKREALAALMPFLVFAALLGSYLLRGI